jgi:N-acetylglutamate synthase
VGDLLELSSDAAVIETRGGRVTIDVADIAVAKVAQPSTAEILELQRICARGWRAAEVVHHGGWTLRADHGFTGRANSVLPDRQLQLPLADALDDARAWYAARGLPLRIQVALPGRRILDNALTELGWGTSAETHVLAGRLDVLIAGAMPGADVEVELADAPDDQWLGRCREGALPPTARELLVRHDRAAFASIRRAGTTVAIARGVVDDRWLGVSAVEVDPASRRQGLAAAMMRRLWDWAVGEHDAVRSYLQVEWANAAALALYERLGYWPHHDYSYRSEAARASA